MAKITLNWTAGTGPISGYKIYRSTSIFDATNFKSYASVIGDTASTTFDDETLTLTDEKYYYGVASYDATANEVLSEVIEVAMISAPTSLTGVFSDRKSVV